MSKGWLPWVPDRLLFGGVPWLMGTGLLALVAAMVLRLPYAFVGFVVLFLLAWTLSREAVARAGGTPALPMWQASKGWTAAEFEVSYRDNKRGTAFLAAAIPIAESLGYRVAGEPTVERGPFGPSRRIHLIRVT